MLCGVQGTPPHRTTGFQYTKKMVQRLWFEDDGYYAKSSGSKPTLFRCQSQFPAKALEWSALAAEMEK
jgi:hypothetical protein